MNSLLRYLLVFLAACGFLSAQTEPPASLQALAWKKISQDLSKDPFFQEDIKKALPALSPEGKSSVTKCISQMIKGNGVAATGSAADAILAKELRGKARVLVPDKDLDALNALSDADLLAIAGGVFGQEQKLPSKVQIVLDSDPTMGLNARDPDSIKLGKQFTRFRIMPGLADPGMVTFEQDSGTGKNLILRHYTFKLFVNSLPDNDPLFNADSTFKIVRLPGDKVKFQSKNYPNKYICVDEKGGFVLTEVSDEASATFRLVGK
ncbi:AbfB domain-containing protein [Luteolibacter luteus]|uniref:Alpha-L-arabinofuranosidase B arabinose-binding domain-containing protein n=1 Tax=Luteolibacter luteus TaxID=2728835 RepID=A0A858RQU1_9BACT|nr:AbfB domain-containing protein [Luteolibacter luteus]QJE98293.1 hypothetical protein HHL09_21760 [Luteolibacter luteus]